MLQGAKIRNLGATIWRAILNIILFAYQGVCLNTVITFTKNYYFLPMHSNVTIKNVSWPHFSWATLYIRCTYSVKAKFHYAILVADRSEAGRRPAASWNLAYH